MYGGDTWSETILLKKIRMKIGRRVAVIISQSSSSIIIQIGPDDASLLGFEMLTNMVSTVDTPRQSSK